MANPVDYSDLFDFSSSKDLNDAVKLLTKLETAYDSLIKDADAKSGIFAKALENIRKESDNLIKKIQPLNINIDEQRQSLSKAADQADMLALKEKDLAESQRASAEDSKRLANELEKIRKVRDKVNKELIANKEAQKEANQIAKQQLIIARSQEGSVERLRAELALTTIAWKKLSKEERENTEEGKRLVRTKKDLTDELKRVEKAAGDTRRNVGNYSEALNEAAASGGSFIETLQGGGAGAGQGIAGLLGKAGPLAGGAAIIGGVGIAFDTLSDKIKEVNKQQEQARKLTQLQGRDLQAFTANLRATSAVFEKDYNEVLKASNVLIQTFDSTGTEAIETINELLIRGVDINDDFLDQISEYSVQFEAAGLTAGNLVEVLLASEQAGIFSDKGADTIKEAGLRLRELTPAAEDALKPLGKLANEQIRAAINAGKTFEAIQLVSKGLSDTNLTAQQTQTIIADVFGGAGEDAGVDFIKSLANINLETEDYTKNLTETQKAQLDFLKSQQDLESELVLVSSSFKTTGTSIKTFFNNVLSDTLEILGDTIEAFTDTETVIENFQTTIAATKDVKLLQSELEDLNKTVEEGPGFFKQLQTGFLSAFNPAAAANLAGKQASEIILKREILNKRIEELGKEQIAQEEEVAKQTAAIDAKKAAAAAKALEDRLRREKDAELLRLAAQDELNALLLQSEIDNIERIFDAEQMGSDRKIELLIQEQEKRLAITKIFRDQQIRELEAEREEVLRNTELTAKERADIVERINTDLLIIQEEAAQEQLAIEQSINDKLEGVIEERVQILEREFQDRQTIIDTELSNELLLIEQKLAEGTVSFEEAEMMRTETQGEFLKKRLENELNFLEEQLKNSNLTQSERLEVEKQIAAARLQIAEQSNAELINKEMMLQEQLRTLRDVAFSSALTVIDNLNQAEDEKRERDLEKLAEQQEAELEAAEGNDERKAAIQAKFAEQENAIREQQAKAERRRAIFEKAVAITQIGIDTGKAIVKAVAASPLTGGLPFSAIAGAIGAAQLAAVISRPIPQFFKGTDSSPAGPAIINELGPEIIEYNGKKAMVYTDGPTLVDLKKGTKIYDAETSDKMLQEMDFDNMSNSFTTPEIVVNQIDTHKIEREIRIGNEMIVDAIRRQKGVKISFMRDDIEFMTENGQRLMKYFNRKYNG